MFESPLVVQRGCFWTGSTARELFARSHSPPEWFSVPCEIPQTFAHSILVYILIYFAQYICYHLLLNYFNRIYRWYIDEWCLLVLIRVVSSQSLDSYVGVSSWLRSPNHFFHTPTVQWEIFRILKWRYVSIIFLAIFWGDIPWNLGLKNRPYIW